VTAERSWPHRFRVTIRTHAGGSVPYSAVTWLSPEKAVALAVAAHLRRNPGGHEVGVHDVEVADLGPVGRDAAGAMALDRGDLIDRAEF
jgi:hypothetical protein